MGDVALEGGSRLTRDIALALIAGFLTGAPAIPIVINLGFATVLKIPLYLIPPIAAALAIALMATSIVAISVPSFF